jgi:hypothetical protein
MEPGKQYQRNWLFDSRHTKVFRSQSSDLAVGRQWMPVVSASICLGPSAVGCFRAINRAEP